MKSAKKGLYTTIALVFAAMIGASSAQAGYIQVNSSGTGLAGATARTSSVAVDGAGFVMTQPNPGNPLAPFFSEVGAYRLTQADGVSPLGPRDLTLAYLLTGTVDLLTGMVSSSGSFSLYSDANFNFGSASANPLNVFGATDGIRIGTFQIASAVGAANGTMHLNGSAIAGALLSGYFFSETGEDLSQSGNLQFDVSIGNRVDPNPSATVISEIICKASGFPGPGCVGGNYENTPFYFAVKDGGQVTLSSVPEPGSTTLVFAGLAGLGLFSRRSRRSTGVVA